MLHFLVNKFHWLIFLYCKIINNSNPDPRYQKFTNSNGPPEPAKGRKKTFILGGWNTGHLAIVMTEYLLLGWNFFFGKEGASHPFLFIDMQWAGRGHPYQVQTWFIRLRCACVKGNRSFQRKSGKNVNKLPCRDKIPLFNVFWLTFYKRFSCTNIQEFFWKCVHTFFT